MNIFEQLIEHEGLRLTAYHDSKGYLTIGVGRLIDARKTPVGITREEAEYLLNNDIARRTVTLDTAIGWWHRINEVRQRVLLDMSFQLGAEGLLSFHQTLNAIQAGDYEQAATLMLQSKWAIVDSPNRALRLSKMMRFGVDVPY